jgi:hypothetical protein
MWRLLCTCILLLLFNNARVARAASSREKGLRDGSTIGASHGQVLNDMLVLSEKGNDRKETASSSQPDFKMGFSSTITHAQIGQNLFILNQSISIENCMYCKIQ